MSTLGPHSLDCMSRLWEEVCLEWGSGHPAVSPSTVELANSGTLRNFRWQLTKFTARANDGIGEDLAACYGTPNNCK